jgi:hypothetical protein
MPLPSASGRIDRGGGKLGIAYPACRVLLARLFVVICRLLLETILHMGHCRRLHPLRLALLASVDEEAADWQA